MGSERTNPGSTGRAAQLTLRSAAVVWAAPASAVGLTVGLLSLMTGGRMQRGLGTLEFHGGFARWMLRSRLVCARAMTLGHVVIGCSPQCLSITRLHELVHVRQYERWGVLFFPAYAASSAAAWLRGAHPYLDNAFEREAFAHEEVSE